MLALRPDWAPMIAALHSRSTNSPHAVSVMPVPYINAIIGAGFLVVWAIAGRILMSAR
jgi:hypothetical protein